MSRSSLTKAALLLSIAIGSGVYASADLLGLAATARAIVLVLGPIAASIAVIAMWRVVRSLIRVNVVLGAALALSVLVADYSGWAPLVITAGIALAALALVPHTEGQRYGGGWLAVPDGPQDA